MPFAQNPAPFARNPVPFAENPVPFGCKPLPFGRVSVQVSVPAPKGRHESLSRRFFMPFLLY
jgi:hypothetical protein